MATCFLSLLREVDLVVVVFVDSASTSRIFTTSNGLFDASMSLLYFFVFLHLEQPPHHHTKQVQKETQLVSLFRVYLFHKLP